MSDFKTLTEVAALDPANADFVALRAAYIDSPVYKPFKHIPQEKLMRITDGASGFEEVAQTCQTILDGNPLDLEARMLLALAQEKLNMASKAEKTHQYAEGLLDAILASGDGKSPETAIVVVAEAEAWTVMRVFGIQAKSQTRTESEARVIDAFKGVLDGAPVTIYFDVTAPARAFDALQDPDEA